MNIIGMLCVSLMIYESYKMNKILSSLNNTINIINENYEIDIIIKIKSKKGDDPVD